MDFPSIYAVLKQEGYQIVEEDGAVETRADSGKLRIRRLWNSSRFRIQFRLAFLGVTDVQAIRQFYRSYRNTEIGWTDPFTGESYTVLMTEPPRYVRTEGRNTVMEIRMEGVLAS